MPRQATTWYTKSLYVALGSDSHHLHAHLVRLNVLYEDLRIELIAASEPEIRRLDATGINFRKQYFMRRAIATTVEFAEGFRLLDQCGDFDTIRQRFSTSQLADWQECVDFFATHEPGLEKIRNDIGGHFGYKAALHAIQDMNRGADGCIRVRLDYGKHTGAIWYEFAGEIAATGMERQKLPTETSQAFFARTFQLLSDCFAHALKGTDLVAVVYTIDRFR